MKRLSLARFAFAAAAAVAAAVLFIAPAAEAGTGSIKGRFVVEDKGEVPELDPLVEKGSPARDAATCAAEAVPNQKYVIGDDGGIANIIVYLKDAPDDMPEDATTPPDTAVVLDQKGCVFVPHVIAAQAGQKVELKSSDPVAHNVRINFFNNTSVNEIVPGNGSTTKTFPSGESAPSGIACDIHPYMQAFIMVADHPYVAVTGEDGSFEIKNLPEGDHKFRVWHEASGYIDRSMKVEVEDGETTDLGDIEVETKDLVDD